MQSEASAGQENLRRRRTGRSRGGWRPPRRRGIG